MRLSLISVILIAIGGCDSQATPKPQSQIVQTPEEKEPIPKTKLQSPFVQRQEEKDSIQQLASLGVTVEASVAMQIGETYRSLECNLTGKEVSDEILACLGSLTHLTTLHFNGQKIPEEGLAHLKGLSNLRYLDLNGTGISDAGLVHLKDLTHLEHLSLISTRVTGSGFVHLTGLPNLRLISFDDEGRDYVAIKEFKQSVPDCQLSPWGTTEHELIK